jgi:hypothetical protein
MILTASLQSALVLAAAVMSSEAQTAPLAGSTFAVTVNRLTLESDSRSPAVEGVFRFTRLRPGGLSLDLGLGYLERDGQGMLALEVGPAATWACPSMAFLYRLGAMGLQTSSGTAAGLYAGISALLRIHGRTGFRLDLARQKYLTAGQPGAWQFGGGVALLPRVR